MKHIKLLLLLVLVLACTGCDLFMPGSKLYITDETFTQTLYTLKILGAGENAANGQNIYSNPDSTVVYDGMTWKVYDIPAGRSDIYMEFNSQVLGSGNNERKEVNASTDGWAAIWFIDSATDDTEAWEGFGSFSLDSCPLYNP